MQKAFIQRREQIVGDCVQLDTDVEAYNALHTEQRPIQMLFDFRDDCPSSEILGQMAA